MSRPPLIFLTGPPGIGKTTAVERIARKLREQGYRVAGIITREIRRHGRREGFVLIDLASGKQWELARREASTPIRVGSYGMYPEALEEAARILQQALQEADVIVIDEVGPMELAHPAFVETLRKVLASGKPVIGTVHYRSTHPLAQRIRREAHLVRLTHGNRDRTPDQVVAFFPPINT